MKAHYTPVHLIIPTHTTRHLDRCLAGIARQSQPSDTLTVSCDVDDPEIEALLRQCAVPMSLRIRYVRRPHQKEGRLAQVRNNAVRALLADGYSSGRILFLDGDIFAEHDCIAHHRAIGQAADMIVASRINLSESETQVLDARRLLNGTQNINVTPEHRAMLDREHRRALWHQRLRRFRLAKSHKPRILGGHHSVTFERFVQVNGNDEEYTSWGAEDDDFARRVYGLGGTSVIAIRDIPVFHLYHPTRAPACHRDHANAPRFARTDLPIHCSFGLDRPMPQDEVRIDVFGPD